MRPVLRIRAAEVRWSRRAISERPGLRVGVGDLADNAFHELGHLHRTHIRQGANVRFAKTSRILDELAGGHADRTWDRRMREIVRPDLLILDDFDMRQMNYPAGRRPL
ncbi:ATP-binding protein [Streptomyces sp. NBC_01351]|uniref:ATP-binding protein n=1 Tax=Streptomyces sp. NBC_01351 TaxID=2903833 RepID=UPI002E3379C8|nr:ATP-binding protein [Streptomyces sp. NBC_01351]